MTFFYNLNKKLDEIRATPSTTHGQLNERANSKPVEEGLGDMARKVGGMVKKVAGKAMDTVGHGSDADMIRDLQKKMGMPQTGMKPGSEPNPKKVSENVGGKIRQPVSQWLRDPRLETQAMSLTAYGINITDPSKGFDGDDANDPGTPSKYSLISTKATNPMYFKEFLNIVMKKDPAAQVVGIVQAGPELAKEGGEPMTAKQKSFAKLAPPENKITFADKIAGAKKEVDEMLGDVAAEAMKKALGGGRGRDAEMDEEASQGNAFTAHKRPKVEKPAVGTVTHGRKHDVEEIPGGRRVTRRVDPSGISVGADDEAAQSGEKRGRGRPKGPAKAPERVTGGATKHKGGRKMTKEAGGMKQTFAILDDTLIDQIAAMNGAEVDPDAGSVETYDENTARQLIAFAQKNPQRLKRTQTMNTAGMKPMAQRVGGTASGPEYDLKEEGADVKAAMKLLKKAGYNVEKAEELDEKAVSKKQQKFMGMVHATQKGEKPASKEVAKTAKSMGKKDAEDFAATKHKGLPEKKKPEGKKDSGTEAPKKKKEKTEEAGGTGTPTASSGFGYGKGIYDSLNRDLEDMIAESMSRLDESMSVNMSMSNEGGMNGSASKTLTVTATDDDAVTLASLLKSAGLGGAEQGGCGCGGSPCSCGSDAEVVDENQPDWPTNTETSDDAMQYSGGLNKPKSTGQTTTPIIHTNDEERQHSYADVEEDAIKRMMEMAGVTEAKGKKPDFLDVDKDGDKKEPFKKAVDDKSKEKEAVDESIFAMTRNLWNTYKG